MMSGVSGSSPKSIIPRRSFGNCRWCGAENARLDYLMCADCFRIADMVPSKTKILLNRPEVRKRLKGEDINVNNVAGELWTFLSDASVRFPADPSLKKHWEKMIEENIALVTREDLYREIEEAKENGTADLGSEQEAARKIGVENLLRFILTVAVLKGSLNLDITDERVERCMICNRPTHEVEHYLCTVCRNEYIRDTSLEDSASEEEKIVPRMATIDIVLGKRRP